MDVPTLILAKLTKHYHTKKATKSNGNNNSGVFALNDISVKLTPGFYGLLGPNGAGKSTMLNIITGTVKPTSGGVLWKGQPISKLGKSYYRILGYMPQQQGMYDYFTGRRFLEYFSALKEVRKCNIQSEVERVVDIVNLTTDIDKRISAYSGGMKQRLLAAQAMLGQPELLVFDEPTAGLDPKERVRLRTTLKDISNHGKIVIVATHVVSDVESVADQIIFLKKGIVADMDSPQILVNKYAPNESLEKVYLNVFGEESVNE